MAAGKPRTSTAVPALGGPGESGLAQVFRNLSKWRAIPGYQSERRIDALMSPFIAPFLECQLARRGERACRVELVTSELPLPAALYARELGEGSHMGSASADFLVLCRGDVTRWILVELKLDLGSRSARQEGRYRQLSNHTMEVLLAELKRAKGSSAFEREYLRVAAVVRSRGNLKPKLEVCYLQPKVRANPKPGATRAQTVTDAWTPHYTFGIGEFASFLGQLDDELAGHLARFLRGTARSEKARRARDRRSKRAANP